MVDAPDKPLVFRNALEARALDIITRINEPVLPLGEVRFPYLRSLFYTDTELLFTGWSAPGAVPFTFMIPITKSTNLAVLRAFDKALAAYDRGK